jgi:hypothetical protein
MRGIGVDVADLSAHDDMDCTPWVRHGN